MNDCNDINALRLQSRRQYHERAAREYTNANRELMLQSTARIEAAYEKVKNLAEDEEVDLEALGITEEELKKITERAKADELAKKVSAMNKALSSNDGVGDYANENTSKRKRLNDDYNTYDPDEQESKRAKTEVEAGKRSIKEQRQSLPIYVAKEVMMELVRDNQVIIVEGETGSGKTTQLLQYLHEEGYHLPLKGLKNIEEGSSQRPRRLICCQPRRLAAMSVAERVAKEMDVQLGGLVGYHVRFDDCTCPKTQIVFMTDGMLLRELSDPSALDSVAVIMIDEAHERSLTTDILLGFIRSVLPAKTKAQLRIILASATIEVERFVSFFTLSAEEREQQNFLEKEEKASGIKELIRFRQREPDLFLKSNPNYTLQLAPPAPPAIRVVGRRHPVLIHFAKAPVSDYIGAAAKKCIELHAAKPLPGDILVFLPGKEEIERCVRLIKEMAGARARSLRPLEVLPVYASLPHREQKLIHEPTPPGKRKIVVATNIAETSLTIDGIVYVIDCGLAKESNYNAASRLSELDIVRISKASAQQRAGRAGRTSPGECLRLYTQMQFYNEMNEQNLPEILRSNLSAVVLQLKAMGVQDLLGFPLVDPPAQSDLVSAMGELLDLGALDPASGAVTAIGLSMAAFPLEPCLARCLVEAPKYRIAEEMAMVAAVLSTDMNLFITPILRHGSAAAEEQLQQQRRRIMDHRDALFKGGTSDLCGYALTLRAWLNHNCDRKWTRDYSLNDKALLRAKDLFYQILKIFDKESIPYRKVQRGDEPGTEPLLPIEEMDERLARVLCVGYFKQIARRDPSDFYGYLLWGHGADPATKPRSVQLFSGSYLCPTRDEKLAASKSIHVARAFTHPEHKKMEPELDCPPSQSLVNMPPKARLPPLVLFIQQRRANDGPPIISQLAAVKDEWLTQGGQ